MAIFKNNLVQAITTIIRLLARLHNDMMGEQDLMSSNYITHLTWMDNHKVMKMDKVLWSVAGTLVSVTLNRGDYIRRYDNCSLVERDTDLWGSVVGS